MKPRLYNLFVSIISFSFVLILLSSCNSNVMFDKSQQVSHSSWDMKDKKSFVVKVKDTDKLYSYRFAINLRNTTDYKYNNIFFFITTIYPDGSITKKDTVECELTYPDGTFKGKGNSDIKDNRFWFAQNVKFNQAGEYVFKIEQATKDTILEGIKDVGLHIERQK